MKTTARLLSPAVVLLGTALQVHAAFTAVDNFNARPVGNIAGQGTWTASDTTSAQVIVDPGNPINKLLWHNGNGDAAVALPATVANNTTGTFFLRVKRLSGTNDNSFGLNDTGTTNPGTPGNYELMAQVNGTQFRGRDAGANIVTTTPTATLQTGAWYKVWLVADNTADTWKFIVQSDDDGAFSTQTELVSTVAPPWNFRNGTAASLIAAQFYGNSSLGSLYFDDLYIDNTGENLSDPTFIADPDLDDDGLEDAWEVFYFTTKEAQDGSDGVVNGDADGLSNIEEQANGTSPIKADTDDDLLNDGDEVYGDSNAYDPGSPTSPTDADSDDDGLTDFEENGSLNTLFGNAPTDPNEPDSDLDTFPDYAEIVQYGTDPNDDGSTPLLLTLIGPSIRNGSFELLGPVPGVENLAMASHWDTDPDGDVTYWTVWPVEATAENNSGTEVLAPVTHGYKRGYLQTNNAVYNLTDHIAQEGETVAFKFDHVVGGPTFRVGLVYDDAGTITRLTGAEVASTATGNGRGMIYTIPPGSPAIGKAIGIGMKATTAPYQDVDNVVLTVTAADVDNDGEGDGLADLWEDKYFGNNDGIATLEEIDLYGPDDDVDDDEFTNLQEQTAGSDPTNPDSIPNDIDADDLDDDWEIAYFLTISNPNGNPGDDPDGDHDINSVEFANGTSPTNKYDFYSLDFDTVPDSWKAYYGIATQTGEDDLDEGTGDGLNNEFEFIYDTDPTDKDSDDDGLDDGDEITAGSNPLVQDTDGDGLLDGPEVHTHLSSPILVDTDGDSFDDNYEVAHLTLPYDELSFPVQPAGFTKVEDFQGAGMTVGQTFNGVNGWYATENSWATVAAEPVAGGGDQVGLLTRGVGVAHSPLRKSLASDGLQIREGNTGTLFFQLFCNVATLDHSFGLSDLSYAAGYGDFEAQFLTVGGNQLAVRDGPLARDSTFDYTIQQWMNVWIVADNASDTLKVYVQTPTGQTGQIEITNDGGINPFDFRNGVTSAALSTFLIMDNAPENMAVYIDNIHVDATAQNLTVPAGATKPGLGDGDSMDDAWETTYFGDTSQTETGDFDNDGTDNLIEFRLGLIPNSGSSRFAVGTTQATPGNFSLTWPSLTGVTFKIERSTSLASGSWTTLQAAYPGTAGTTTYNDATAPAGSAFYKITLNP